MAKPPPRRRKATNRAAPWMLPCGVLVVASAVVIVAWGFTMQPTRADEPTKESPAPLPEHATSLLSSSSPAPPPPAKATVTFVNHAPEPVDVLWDSETGAQVRERCLQVPCVCCLRAHVARASTGPLSRPDEAPSSLLHIPAHGASDCARSRWRS